MENDDRFGIPATRIVDAIRKHAGLVRSGCYVPTRHEVATREPEWVHSIVLDWWWESPSELIPREEQVREAVTILRQRPDADHPLIQAILADIP